jgi:ribonuclease T1
MARGASSSFGPPAQLFKQPSDLLILARQHRRPIQTVNHLADLEHLSRSPDAVHQGTSTHPDHKINPNEKQLLALTTLLITGALAIPTEKRACAYTCGTVRYTSSAVAAAQAAGYKLQYEGQTDDSYPHVYHNYEGFDFPVSGTYYEFPILSNGDIYDGGSPGADRVIFNSEDELAGVITHTGASGDDFVSC